MSLYIDNKYIRLLSSRLRNFKQKKEDLYNFSCPICGDSKKNLLKSRGYVYKKGNDLYYTCYNCSVGTTLSKLVEQVDPALHKEYVMERYSNGDVGRGKVKAPTFNIPPPKFDNIKKASSYNFSSWISDLDINQYCRVYVENRKIPKKFFSDLLYTSHYKQFLDDLVPDHGKSINDDERLVIPFYDENNELIAVSGRALQSGSEKLRYVTVRTVESNKKLIYGMNRLDKQKPVKIVEGPIDSLFLDNCVASGDSNLVITAEELIKSGVNKENITLCMDNESRNKDVMRILEKAIKAEFKVVIWPDNIQEKDVNDMVKSDIDVESIISNNTFCGLEAYAKFNFYKKV